MITKIGISETQPVFKIDKRITFTNQIVDEKTIFLRLKYFAIFFIQHINYMLTIIEERLMIL